MPTHTVVAYEQELKDLAACIAEMWAVWLKAWSPTRSPLWCVSDNRARPARHPHRPVSTACSAPSRNRRSSHAAASRWRRSAPHSRSCASPDLRARSATSASIAKRVIAMGGAVQVIKSVVIGVEHPPTSPSSSSRAVLFDAYTARDAGAAICARALMSDRRLYTPLLREPSPATMEDPRNITFCTHLPSLRQEHRAHRRSRHQRRRGGPISGHRRAQVADDRRRATTPNR